MTKLAELIRRVTRIEPAPMGFGSAPRRLPPTMLLVGLIDERWARGVRDAVSGGADAVLLTGQPAEKDLAEAVAAAEGRPCGLLIPQADAEAPSRLRQAGLDFLVLDPDAPASALLDEELAFVVQLKEEFTDVQLRTLDALLLDAIYLEREVGPLAIRQQMELQRISGLARRPLLVRVRPDAEQQDLLCLRDAGVALAALDLGERGAADALGRLRSVIDGLPPRRRLRREDRAEVVLPPPGEAAKDEDEEE